MPPLTRQINVTYRCGMMYRDHQLKDLDINGCQTPYLLPLFRKPGMTQEELAAWLCVNKSSVTRQVAALEKQGYIRRACDPKDRRVLRLFPTEKAMATQERLKTMLGDWRAYLVQDLTEEEQATLSSLMDRITRRAEAYVKGEEEECISSEPT